MRSASIVVAPSLYPWGYEKIHPTFDSELDWTAYCCAQTTKFVQMDSNLSLQYLNSQGKLVSYPSYYTFGDVQASASNLRVMDSQTGAHVVIGENNNTYLGN